MQLLSDAETLALVRGAQAHDDQALTELYSYISAPLYRYFMVRTRDPHLSEALQSDVVLRLLEAIRQFQPPANGVARAFLGWVFRVAASRLIDHYRRTKRVSVPLDDAVIEQQAAPCEMERALDRGALVAALGRLTAEQQQVIRLRFLEGRSTDEVAAMTGQSIGAVKAMQHRALRTLATILADGDAGAQRLARPAMAARGAALPQG